jgi:hypothetical protein
MAAMITGCNLPKIKPGELFVVNIMSAHHRLATWLTDRPVLIDTQPKAVHLLGLWV